MITTFTEREFFLLSIFYAFEANQILNTKF